MPNRMHGQQHVLDRVFDVPRILVVGSHAPAQVRGYLFEETEIRGGFAVLAARHEIRPVDILPDATGTGRLVVIRQFHIEVYQSRPLCGPCFGHSMNVPG